MAKKHRNSPERAEMLEKRRRDQEARGPASSMRGVPAWMNRRTRKPHENNRQKGIR